MGNGETPVIKYDRKGRIFCPVCQKRLPNPMKDHRLGRGIARCDPGPKGHDFLITDDAAFAINEIWDKIVGADKGLGREFFRNIGDDPIDEIIGD